MECRDVNGLEIRGLQSPAGGKLLLQHSIQFADSGRG